MDISQLDFVVVSGRTGNPVASFLLPGDALNYIAYRRSIEGCHGPVYEIRNADDSFVGWGLQEKAEKANHLPAGVPL